METFELAWDSTPRVNVACQEFTIPRYVTYFAFTLAWRVAHGSAGLITVALSTTVAGRGGQFTGSTFGPTIAKPTTDTSLCPATRIERT